LTEVPSTRALNRALLARQMLLERAALPVADAVERLVGMQAQNPRDPYIALWSRLNGFDPAELSELIATRRAVRVSLMRSTIHLVSADDCVAIRPVLQQSLERKLYTATPFGRQVDGVDVAALKSAGRALLEAEPMTFAELGRRLSATFPDYDPTALGYAVREYVPLVQVPPRGIWGRSGRALHTPAEHWLGRALPDSGDLDGLLDRYLRAFGPATASDFAAWSGIPAGPLNERYGRDPLDAPDAPRPDPDTPAPIRFLPDFDNVLLAHADRSRIFPAGARGSDVIGKRTVLIDGFVAAFWKLADEELRISPIRRLTRDERRELKAEAEALLAWLAPSGRVRLG
jgi:hypothetical protein